MITLQEEHKMTVREACKLIRFINGDCDIITDKLRIAADGYSRPFDRDSVVDMTAYGDFILSGICVSPEGVELELKREFVRATPTA